MIPAGGGMTSGVPGQSFFFKGVSGAMGGALSIQNSAAAIGGGAGADFAQASPISGSAILDFTGLTSLEFLGDSAGDSGGGIGIRTASGDARLTIGTFSTFQNNSAGIASDATQGNGGAIFVRAAGGDSNIALGDKAYFLGNAAKGLGGAIYVQADASHAANLTIGGNAKFQGNASNGAGGAIYFDGGSQGGALSLDTSLGTIGFDGNKAAGAANAISMAGKVKLSLSGARSVYFNDPVYSMTGAGDDTMTVALGANRFAQFLEDSSISGTANGNAVDVQSGAMRVVQGASFTARRGVFHVASGATLAGGGSLAASSFTLDGKISPDDVTLAMPIYDAEAHVFSDDPELPGGSIGKLDLTGDVVFGDSSDYEVDIRTDGSSDRVDVSGHTTVEPGASITVPSKLASDDTGKKFVIVDSSEGQSGTFGRVNDDSLYYDVIPGYDADTTWIAVVRNSYDPCDAAQSANEHAVCEAATPDINGDLINGGAQNGAQTREDLNEMSGEIHASAHAMLAAYDEMWGGQLIKHSHKYMEKNRAVVLAQDSGVMSDAGTPVIDDHLPGNAWATADGYYSKADSNDNAASARLKGGSLSVGIDGRVSELQSVGIAVRMGKHKLRVNGGRDSEADIDSWGGAFFGETRFTHLHFVYGGQYSVHEIDASRNVTVNGYQTLKSNYSLGVGALFAEGGYRWHMGNGKVMVEPFLGAEWTHLDQEGFKEHGGDQKLRSKGWNGSNATGSLGARGEWLVAHKILQAELSWKHTFGNVDSRTNFSFDGGKSAEIFGVRSNRNALAANFGIAIPLGQTGNATLKLSYDGLIGDNSQTHGGYATLNYHW
jgi:outer membrane autotransporter protein